jgi:acrylyl-CoA reductase (NADPH)
MRFKFNTFAVSNVHFSGQNMMDTPYRALQVSNDGGIIRRDIVSLNTGNLPANDLLIRVQYSSVNYKDALSAAGNKGVTRKFPHTPGIDAAGEVVSSHCEDFQSGDKVLVTGYDLGMNTWGGFGQYISVPREWALHLPAGLSPAEAMALGTAGLTAGLSIDQLVRAGIRPGDGKIVVSGATGGVGSLAASILKRLGYTTVAISGKANDPFLTEGLGFDEVIDRETVIAKQEGKPLGPTEFIGGIDTVSGPVLSAILKSTKSGGVVTCCGMVGSASLETSIFPFILRGVRLIGIDSVEIPLSRKKEMWEQLAGSWKPANLNNLCREISLGELPAALDLILDGKAKGRFVLRH